MAIQYWMTFCITFRDRAEYDLAVGICGGGPTCIITPQAAGVLFGLGPNVASWPTGDVSTVSKFGWFTSPYGVGSELRFPGPTGVFLQENVLNYNVACQPGIPASIWPCPGDGSHDAIFTWVLSINFEGSFSTGSPSPPPTANPIPQRRWIAGLENSALLEGGTSQGNSNISRDASRTIDGFGHAVRGNLGQAYNRTTTEFRPALNPPTSWERFYVRVRRIGAAGNATFWRCRGFPSAGAGCQLQAFLDGTIHAVDTTAFAVERDQGVVMTPTLFQWYRFDVFLKFHQGASDGRIRVYINGEFTFGYDVSDNNGMDGGQYHLQSDLGSQPTNANWEIDTDDWMCADLPANIDPDTLEEIDGNFPIDWFMGSHMKRYFIDPVTGSSTNWTGTRAAMNQGMGPSTALTNLLTSATALARIEAISDTPTLDVAELDPTFPILGVASFIVGLYSRNFGGTDGQLGYRLAGGGDTLVTVDQQNVSPGSGKSMMYIPTGMEIPAEVAPLHLVHTKSNDANQDNSIAICVTVELLGAFGEEDGFVLPINRLGWIHNQPYSNTIFGMLATPVAAPVYAVGGTYVGNNTFTKVTLPAPPHFIWIRALTVGVNGVKWWSSMINAHIGGQEALFPGFRTGFDGVDFFFEVSGQHADINQNAITYQYIAFCDPGGRFCLNTAFIHQNAATTPFANPLWQPDFLAEWAFSGQEAPDDNTTTARLATKGPGNTANQGTLFSGTNLANYGTFSTGFFNNLSDLQAGVGSVPLSLWRSSEPGCAGTMVQIMTYTGNGGGARAINLTPVSGRFPLFVMVQPVGAQGFFRDPSHAGNNSANIFNLSNSTTAITAVAIDQITVGATLNVNLTVYNVFAICGDTAGMLNGSYTNLFCELPDGPQNNAPPFPSNEPNVNAIGGLILGGSPALTLLQDVSGIYTLVLNKRNDTLIDRQTGQDSVDVEIPDPTFKTGYIGG